ncbi:MAG: DUF5652 family protein [Candidatus Pacebacteria bacterium]|nr:DUF5652 family protein [Candidatus Paceibacterota bacterium]
MNQLFFGMHTESSLFFFLFLVLMVWTITWKGLALWKAARGSDKWWFIALLVINTAGILDILYYYFFSKRSRGEKPVEQKTEDGESVT